MTDKPTCNVCGHPMPEGEEMFNFHGYSGPCPVPPLRPAYQLRVIEEKRELEEKISKLTTFLSADTFRKLDTAQQDRLRRQYSYMVLYSSVLHERIEVFIK